MTAGKHWVWVWTRHWGGQSYGFMPRAWVRVCSVQLWSGSVSKAHEWNVWTLTSWWPMCAVFYEIHIFPPMFLHALKRLYCRRYQYFVCFPLSSYHVFWMCPQPQALLQGINKSDNEMCVLIAIARLFSAIDSPQNSTCPWKPKKCGRIASGLKPAQTVDTGDMGPDKRTMRGWLLAGLYKVGRRRQCSWRMRVSLVPSLHQPSPATLLFQQPSKAAANSEVWNLSW